VPRKVKRGAADRLDSDRGRGNRSASITPRRRIGQTLGGHSPCVTPRPCELRQFWSPVIGRECIGRRAESYSDIGRAEMLRALVHAEVVGCPLCGAEVDPSTFLAGTIEGERAVFLLCKKHLREWLTPMTNGGSA